MVKKKTSARKRYRFVETRIVWCPVFVHQKSVAVCRAAPYEDCQTCRLRYRDIKNYGSRTHRVVETSTRPGLGLFQENAVVEINSGEGNGNA